MAIFTVPLGTRLCPFFDFKVEQLCDVANSPFVIAVERHSMLAPTVPLVKKFVDVAFDLKPACRESTPV